MARIDRLGRQAAQLALVAALAACSTMPSQRPEPGRLSETWQDAPAAAADPASLVNWWEGFNDPLLNRLVADALQNGGSVRLAALRVREARALSRSTIAAYLPQIDAFASGDYRQSLQGPDLPTSDLSGFESEQMVGAYGPQVSWEIPLFGRIQAAAVGARANTRAAAADFRGAQVALAADVAQAYVDLRQAQQSRAALQEAVQFSDRLAEIVAISANAGFAAPAEAADARRQAETNRTRLPATEIEALRAERVLAVLRGRAPGAEEAEIATALRAQAQVPSLGIAAAPALPADLVRLRPDVAQAEAAAILRAADVGIARSNLLPQLNLSGSISVADNLIGNAVGGRSSTLSLTPFITIPLFDWGQRLAQVDASDARFQQALVQYRETVNGAVNEAANALTALDQGTRRLRAARAAEAAAEASTRGARAAHEAGIRSLADYLLTVQQLIDARLVRIDAEAQQARAAIAVYRAFGGGPALTTG